SASQLEHDSVSPTAHANPYFAHQGQPALRHHNDTSRPPSPPDTPKMVPNVITPNNGTAEDQAGKEELQRKLRRVASAPNAQGMFSSSNKRPGTADPAAVATSSGSPVNDGQAENNNLLPVPVARDPRTETLKMNASFKRTYSSNSI